MADDNSQQQNKQPRVTAVFRHFGPQIHKYGLPKRRHSLQPGSSIIDE